MIGMIIESVPAEEGDVTNPDVTNLSDRIDFGVLGTDLARDLVESLHVAIQSGVRFDTHNDPLTIFRNAVKNAVGTLEKDQARFDLFIRFLRDGPFENPGPVPPSMLGKRLTDDEARIVVRFIYHRVVSVFQGALAELLAVGPYTHLIGSLRRQGLLPNESTDYFGDATFSKTGATQRPVKGADIITLTQRPSGAVSISAIAEVKSYRISQRKLDKQISKQIQRLQNGILVINDFNAYDDISTRRTDPARVVRIAVAPSLWKLPRVVSPNRREDEREASSRHPGASSGKIVQTGERSWRILLKWSHEALASAAFEMTYWLMGQIGEAAFSTGKPRNWDKMTSEAAGRNAVKMMLYSLLLRVPEGHKDEGPAIALYNIFSFGYALGANFRDADGRRQMLWFEDLAEIARFGVTKHGFRISP